MTTPKNGKPSAKRRRTVAINIRVTPLEHSLYERASRLHDSDGNVSRFVRQTLTARSIELLKSASTDFDPSPLEIACRADANLSKWFTWSVSLPNFEPGVLVSGPDGVP